MNKRHRIFIAINFPNDIKKSLAKFSQKWADLPARWTSRENLHITLSFLGYLNDIELANVCMAVKEAVQRHNPFLINLNKISYGPDEKNPRMIWARGESLKELSLLKNDLKETLSQKIHFVSEKRGFNPHVTLARINVLQWRTIEPYERPEIDEPVDLVFSVESIEIMESVLKKAGSKYTVIESMHLND